MGEGREGRSRGEKGVVEMEEGRGLSLNLGREGKGRPDDIFKDVCSIGFVEEEGRGILSSFSPPVAAQAGKYTGPKSQSQT